MGKHSFIMPMRKIVFLSLFIQKNPAQRQDLIIIDGNDYCASWLNGFNALSSAIVCPRNSFFWLPFILLAASPPLK